MNKSVFPERQKSFVAVPLSFLRGWKLQTCLIYGQIHAAQVADEEERLEVDAMSSLANGFMGCKGPTRQMPRPGHSRPGVDGTTTMTP